MGTFGFFVVALLSIIAVVVVDAGSYHRHRAPFKGDSSSSSSSQASSESSSQAQSSDRASSNSAQSSSSHTASSSQSHQSSSHSSSAANTQSTGRSSSSAASSSSQHSSSSSTHGTSSSSQSTSGSSSSSHQASSSTGAQQSSSSAGTHSSSSGGHQSSSGSVSSSSSSSSSSSTTGPTPPASLTWPNAQSKANSDVWISQNHQSIKLLQPKLLVLNFANPTLHTQNAENLVASIISGIAEGSKGKGSRGQAQVQYQVVKFVGLRDGDPGFAPADPSWPYQNSHQYPRLPSSSPDYWKFGYASLFNETYAEWIGLGGTLCELLSDGAIHEVWVVSSGDVPDANMAEVLEMKQIYDENNKPVQGQFTPCAGNGCFDSDVPHCGRSIRIGSVNYNRGPGCYLHSHGHGQESAAGYTNAVPYWAKWFKAFAAFDWNTRYGLPWQNAYGIQCSGSGNPPNCMSHPTETSIVFYNAGSEIQKSNFDFFCGNVHFPPNSDVGYDYDNTQTVLSSCVNYGQSGALAPVNNSLWVHFENQWNDCGGGFLVWWYQQMPWPGSGMRNSDGTAMYSPGPFLFY